MKILRRSFRRSRRSEAHRDRLPGSDGAPTPPGMEAHPLPWRNTPVAGKNCLIDARGDVVYLGYDTGEMFRLLAAATARAGRPPRRNPPAPAGLRSVTGPRTPESSPTSTG